VPEDLADILVTAGLATEYSKEWRSAFPGIVEAAATVSCTIITLLQAPPTIGQTANLIRSWFMRRKSQGEEILRMTVTMPSGQRVEITIAGAEEDYTTMARLVVLLCNQTNH
jgi:hypothetical protein